MKRAVYVITTIAVVALSAYLYWARNIVTSIPGFEVKDGSYVISNCEQPRDENAVRVCPKLYCWKAIYDSRQVTAEYTAVPIEDQYLGGNKPFILTGKIQYRGQVSGDVPTRYRCVMKGDDVMSLDLLTEGKWWQLNISGKLWEI